MSTFTEEITLKNIKDEVRVECGLRKDVRALTVDAMVDTGAWTLVINEETRQKLGLKIVETTESSLANGAIDQYALTEPIEIHWKDRRSSQEAVVLPNAKYILLGALPLEAMDLMVDPVDECLKGRHGDKPLHILC